MHALKKAGLTIVTGSLIGAFATVAMADNNTLMNVGDYGTFSFAGPNGFGDQVWATDTDSFENGVLIQYMTANGLAIQDSSGEVTTILVDTPGSGYGTNSTFGGVTFQNAGNIAFNDGTVAPTGWWALNNVNNTGSGGFGLTGAYKIDGPAGGIFYQQGFGGQNDFVITNGSTGFMPGPNFGNTYFGSGVSVDNTNALEVNITGLLGGDLGLFGFVNLGAATESGKFGIQSIYTAGAALGQQLDAAVIAGNKNTTLFINNDNATIKPDEDQYGNFRNYLGATPPAANGNNVAWAGSAAGEVANLAIVANGTARDADSPTGNGNATSGIGYSAGNFMVYDAEGKLVDGLTIAYDIDLDGRVYTGALGAYNGVTDTIYNGPNQVTITANVNNTSGWRITANTNSATNSAGWTVVPQGNGTGFQCDAVHLYGQLIALQSMATNATSDTTTTPLIAITARGSAVAPSFTLDNYSISSPHAGDVVAAAALVGGQNYLNAPTVSTAVGDSGTGATFTALLGGVGQRMITNSNGSALTLDLVIPEYELFTNGDFNGDGYSDLVWDSVEYGTYVWNLGADARVLSAGLVASPGGAWDLVGCGQFGYSDVGSCMFWYNDETGQTAVWVVNSSLPDTADWLVGGLVLETLEDMNWLARCTNNGTQNSGSNVYWHNADTGQFAVWPINVNDNGTTAALDADGAGFVTVGGGSIQEILLPASDGWSLVGAANMAGRPAADMNIQRDMILQSSNGTTAMWLMDDTGLAIDVTAATGSAGAGAGLVQYLGEDTAQDDSFVGVALYDINTVYSLDIGLGSVGRRVQQFATLNWTTGFTTPDTEGGFTAATWKMDRNISLINYDVTPVTGTGLSTMPWTIDFPVSW